MRQKLTVAAIALLSTLGTSHAAEFDVQITNLTRGSYFTPFLVAAHPASYHAFVAGSAAGANLQAMAEGGSITGLTNDLSALSATSSNNPAGGLLAPGASTTATLNTTANPANTHLSVLSMLLPSNDGFAALDSIQVPTTAGVYTYNLNAYDAGTEANDEIRGGGAPGTAGFPAPGPVGTASGTGGTGVTGVTAENYVHIHRGALGDSNATDGESDIVNTVQRWLNPVVRVTVTVK